MTPVDEAVERVREDLAHADAQGHHALLMPIEDLRALLSALELGSVGPSALPVVTADEPATPLRAELLARLRRLTRNALRVSSTVNGRDIYVSLALLLELEEAFAVALSASTTDSGNKIVTGMREAVSGEAARVRNVRVAADSGKGRLDAEAGGWKPTREWLRAKIEADPDDDECEARPAPPTGEGGGL